jgi:hypothetical protein
LVTVLADLPEVAPFGFGQWRRDGESSVPGSRALGNWALAAGERETPIEEMVVDALVQQGAARKNTEDSPRN